MQSEISETSDSVPPDLPEFAAMDPDCVLAPGLFRSIPKGGSARRQRLEVAYHSHNDDTTITFLSPDLLGVDDLRVLQGIMALVTREAMDEGSFLLDDSNDEEGMQLVLGLEPKDNLKNQVALRLNGSWRSVARAVGLNPNSGSVIKKIQKSVERLCMVGVKFDGAGMRGAVHFMAGIWKKDGDPGGGPGNLKVALNPCLANIALAGLGELGHVKYVRMDLREVRSLRSDAARLIHQRICAFINPGASGRVRLDTLCAYVWPEATPSARAMAARRQRARRGLRELEGFDQPWTVVEYSPGRFEIGRPARA